MSWGSFFFSKQVDVRQERGCMMKGPGAQKPNIAILTLCQGQYRNILSERGVPVRYEVQYNWKEPWLEGCTPHQNCAFEQITLPLWALISLSKKKKKEWKNIYLTELL